MAVIVLAGIGICGLGLAPLSFEKRSLHCDRDLGCVDRFRVPFEAVEETPSQVVHAEADGTALVLKTGDGRRLRYERSDAEWSAKAINAWLQHPDDELDVQLSVGSLTPTIALVALGILAFVLIPSVRRARPRTPPSDRG